MTGGLITGINVTNGGSGYTETPYVHVLNTPEVNWHWPTEYLRNKKQPLCLTSEGYSPEFEDHCFLEFLLFYVI